MVVCAAAAGAELVADAAGRIEELLPELLQAAMSVTAAVAAIAVMAVLAAREGLVAREGPTPGRLRNLMGTSWWRSPGPRRALVRSAARGPGVSWAGRIGRLCGSGQG